MTNANDMQVGGDHYTVASPLTPREVRALRGRLKHWDVIAIMGWDYFIGNITKYFHRHDKKNGWEDAKKGYHYAVKWMENEYPEEFADLQEEQSEALFASWEQADGAELPTWLLAKVTMYLGREGAKKAKGDFPRLADYIVFEGLHEQWTVVKDDLKLDISDGSFTVKATPAEWLEIAKGKAAPKSSSAQNWEGDYLHYFIERDPSLHPLLKSLSGIGNSKTARLQEISEKLRERDDASTKTNLWDPLRLSREEADVVLRVFEAGKITVLEAKDDGARSTLMKRLKEYFRVRAPVAEAMEAPYGTSPVAEEVAGPFGSTRLQTRSTAPPGTAIPVRDERPFPPLPDGPLA